PAPFTFSLSARSTGMFRRLSILLVINKVAGASPTTEYVSGIFHSSGGAFLKFTVKRSCVSRIFPYPSRLTFTTGNPGCSVQPAAISPTGFFEASESAFHKSAVVEFEYLCAAMYLRIPSRKTSSPRKLSSIRKNDWPFLYVISSKALLASASVATGCWIGWVVDRASPSIAASLAIPTRRLGSRGNSRRSQTSHCGLKCTVHLEPIHEANPSLSHKLSHQAIVTRSPNHWCAISCARTS